MYPTTDLALSTAWTTHDLKFMIARFLQCSDLSL